ncbi:exopolyphosphatase, putative [Talaromyces stipitatus ATCC 10500]|uniref:Exopolyphosphatase, putative n=1 Tax=Talaromyces stipitatus (strain ATCC 10500 / CBS 375.48 / QM 6759 / NRRL 1006) TaxID=441959 RepID=B8MDC9_TALSN|nr:exopolyphosphatase, putative [Talaromyces stipitatus ATCC 10500]EED17892.1 exopolyphosphatase, putative [Talaromyces stipitatus ATCC 10500]
MPQDTSMNLGPSHITSSGLLPFLKHARHHFLPTIRNGITTYSPIYVLGNQSADLDSIISAILYSYVPLVNLTDVRGGSGLRRLRPEFACALELAVSSSSSSTASTEGKRDKDGEDGIVQLLKEHILTVADLREGLLSSPDVVNTDAEPKKMGNKLELDCVMVDWNNLPHKTSPQEEQGKGSIDGLSDLVSFTVTGCIDHRPDEGFVPPLGRLPEGSPRVIISGPGSCTSLVIREIRERVLWPVSSSEVHEERQRQHVSEGSEEGDWEVQLAKLALASILIDTTNLTAEGKVTDVDREAASFLTERISSSSPTGGGGKEWDRDSFFQKIQYAKAHSLDWLTVDEMLGRDYKDWTETTPSGDKKVIGIASVVRPLNWIIDKGEDEDDKSTTADDNLKSFLGKLKKFALERHLDVISVMTAFNTEDDGKEERFARELLVWGLEDDNSDALEKFANTAKKQLGLQKWNEFPIEGSHEYSGRLYIWKQGNVSQSRKQVAPLLRRAFTG